MSTYNNDNQSLLDNNDFEDEMEDENMEEEIEGVSAEEIKSPVKAIRAFCIDCMGGAVREVKMCPSKICPLHAFRMGKNPYRKRELSPEHLAKLQEAREKAMVSKG